MPRSMQCNQAMSKCLSRWAPSCHTLGYAMGLCIHGKTFVKIQSQACKASEQIFTCSPHAQTQMQKATLGTLLGTHAFIKT